MHIETIGTNLIIVIHLIDTPQLENNVNIFNSTSKKNIKMQE